jgi:acylphosphatase
MAKAGFQAIVSGRVQGVGFRYSAVRVARALRLGGNVFNRWDGGVEVTAEGERQSLEQFSDWLREGPPGAFVRDVQITWLPFTGDFEDFEVRY